jgi:tetratricopeptide (TPR) repeat protein
MKSSKANDHEKSIALLNEALNDPGAAIYAHALLGAEYLRADRLHDALPQLQAARDKLPRSPGNRSNLGFALCLTGEYNAGKHELEEALRLDRQLPQAHYLLGLVKLHESEVDAGVEHLRSAAGGMTSARLMLAVLYLRDGDGEASEKELLAYREKHPERTLDDLHGWVKAAARRDDLANIGFHLGSQD